MEREYRGTDVREPQRVSTAAPEPLVLKEQALFLIRVGPIKVFFDTVEVTEGRRNRLYAYDRYVTSCSRERGRESNDGLVGGRGEWSGLRLVD